MELSDNYKEEENLSVFIYKVQNWKKSPKLKI